MGKASGRLHLLPRPPLVKRAGMGLESKCLRKTQLRGPSAPFWTPQAPALPRSLSPDAGTHRALGSRRQGDCEFKAGLGYVGEPCFPNTQS